MKRKSKQTPQPIAVISGDWHLRDTQPAARNDNFWDVQWHKIRWILSIIERLKVKYEKIPLLLTGDIFDHWKPSPYLLQKTIEVLNSYDVFIYTVYGNHELPQHNLNLREKSGLRVLESAGVMGILPRFHWGEVLDNENDSGYFGHINLAVWHEMIWKGESPIPGLETGNVYDILEKYDNYDIILTGHNHRPFVASSEDGKRRVVNPGSITRQTGDQVDHTPRVYVLYDDFKVEPWYIPIRKDVVSRVYIERKKRKEEQNERITAFIDKLDDDNSFTKFEDKLEYYMRMYDVSKDVRKAVNESLEK